MIGKRSLAAIAAACCFAFLTPAMAQELSGAEVEALLKGKTFNTEDFGGTGTIAWGDDGAITVDVTKPDGSKVSDVGTYRFDDSGYCSTWSTLRTEEKCFKLQKTSDTTYEILNLDGSLDSTLTAM